MKLRTLAASCILPLFATGACSSGGGGETAQTPTCADGQVCPDGYLCDVVTHECLSGQGPFVGAPGVRITKVAIYQGPERIILLNGMPTSADLPLVQGRPALVRVWYELGPEFDGGGVIAELAGAGAPIRFGTQLTGGSNDASLESTVNFNLSGDRVHELLDLQIGLLQFRDPSLENSAARHTQRIEIKGKPNKLRVVLVPYQYNADGSGRLPDTSPEQVQKYRDRFMALYPVSDVEVSVHDPVAWSGAITRDGTGWQEVGINLFGLRQQESPNSPVYYYGIFDPAASLQQFCSFGCLLGVTLLNNSPSDVGDDRLRLGIGVGFAERAADTATHEIGHAHGRNHAPCGPGLDPQSIDGSYPYQGGGIGVWGYDVTTNQLQDPGSVSDIMGYCDNQFISDYNYRALYNRTQNVNQPDLIPPPSGSFDYVLYTVSGQGSLRRVDSASFARPLAARPVTVSLHGGGGQREVEGQYYVYDHLPGGWLFVPRSGSFASISVELDGQRLQSTN